MKYFIEAILQGDENAPRKQKHTAHRIWSRIRKELPEVEVARELDSSLCSRAED